MFRDLSAGARAVSTLALIDTSARPNTAEQTRARWASLQHTWMAGFLPTALDNLTNLLHPSRRSDPCLREINSRMALDVGLKGFARQLDIAISRPDLAAMAVDTLVVVGDSDPPAASRTFEVTGRTDQVGEAENCS
jgi:hypothetical protein